MRNTLLQLPRRLKIGPKLTIGFGILIALMLVGYGLGLSAGRQAAREIDRTTSLRAPTALAAARAQANLLRLVADLQAYLALGDPQYRDSYAAAQAAFEADLATLETILNQPDVLVSPDYRELAASLESLRRNYTAWSELVPQLFELRDDQLRREPGLKLLIVDAAPHINTIIVNSLGMLKTQQGREPTRQNVALLGGMAEFQSSFYAMLSGLRGYATTRRDSFKFEYQANLDANQQALDKLLEMRRLLSPSQVESLKKIESGRAAFLQVPEQMFAAVEGERAREDLYLFRTQALPLADNMVRLLTEETELQQNLLQSELNAGRARLERAQQISIGGAAVVLLAGLVLAWATGRDIALPILRLAGTAQQIQAGDLAAQAEVDRSDEIGILGTAFNAMTAQLRQTLQSLLDYLEQVKIVMSAAAAVEEDRFDPAALDGLSRRDDALGQLARVFQKMAREVRLREEKLKQQVKELKIVLDDKRQDQKVAEITESQYFKDLQSEADTLRDLLAGVVEEA